MSGRNKRAKRLIARKLDKQRSRNNLGADSMLVQCSMVPLGKRSLYKRGLMDKAVSALRQAGSTIQGL